MASLLPNISDPQAYIAVEDDFVKLDTAATNGYWLSTNDGTTGTLALNTGTVGGWINIPSAAADNDYQLLSTQVKVVKFAASKPVWFDCSLTLTEAATNAANWVCGVSSVITTGFLANDGAGPPSTFDGAVFYKVDGGSSILFRTSKATTATTNTSISTFTSGTNYRLSFHFDPCDGTTGLITPFVNSVAAAPHRITISGLGAMYVMVGVKAGSASAETVNCDYIRCYATR